MQLQFEIEGVPVGVPLQWVGDNKDVISTVDMVHVDVSVSFTDQSALVLSFGRSAFPIMEGSGDERRAQIKKLDHIPIHTLARLALPLPLAEYLIQNLTAARNSLVAAQDQSNEEAE